MGEYQGPDDHITYCSKYSSQASLIVLSSKSMGCNYRASGLDENYEPLPATIGVKFI